MGPTTSPPNGRAAKIAILRQTAEKCHKKGLVRKCESAPRAVIPCEQALCRARPSFPRRSDLEICLFAPYFVH